MQPGSASPWAVREHPDTVPLSRRTADLLKDVFLSAVLPQLAAGTSATAPRRHPPSPRLAEIVDALLAIDPGAALALVRGTEGSDAATPLLCATLLEPAARRLGDLWREDTCSEAEVTLGLCRLQTLVRLLAVGAPLRSAWPVTRPVVLVVPQPGELHRLGAVLDSAVLQDAGWAPQFEYPATDAALHDTLSAAWFDVLDLSLSTAFRRDQVLPRLRATIAQARRASRNPDLVVVVGGRIFFEEASAALRVGADHASTTSYGLDRTILATLAAARTTAAAETHQVTATPS